MVGDISNRVTKLYERRQVSAAERLSSTGRCSAAPLGSWTVQVICSRLLQPTGRFRRRSLSLIVRQQNYSHQKMQIVFLILAHWLTANLLAIGSLTLSFTRFRSGSVAIVLAIIVGAYGLLLSIAQGFPTRGIHLIHLLSWFPVLIACTSTVVWYRARAGKTELPNKAVVDNQLPAPSRNDHLD
jgi:hypothetical protein